MKEINIKIRMEGDKVAAMIDRPKGQNELQEILETIGLFEFLKVKQIEKLKTNLRMTKET